MKRDISPIARELREARERLKLSRQQLADQSGFTPSYVEKVEYGIEPVRGSYLERVAPVLESGVDVGALLERMHADGLRRPAVSEWLSSWLEIERQADIIRWFEPLLIPGLVQVEGYARALLDTEEQVAARLARQDLFTRDRPPEVVFIVDESVLHGHVADPRVMAEQLDHLLEVPAVVQVLPADTDIAESLSGGFVLASIGEREYVYVSTRARGLTLDNRDIVSQVGHDWDVLGREALTPRLSRDLIVKAAEEWKAQSS